MRVAYLVNQYPSVSHTFIRREIHALERRGMKVTRFALRGWDAPLPDQDDQQERQLTRYVLKQGPLPLLGALLAISLMRPLCLIRALALIWRMGRRAERPFAAHLVYLAEACLLAWWLRSSDIGHLHAHFGTNSAEVAMLVHVLGGPRWSFTAHGPEEFDKARLIGLSEKMKRAAFVIAVSSFGRSQLFRYIEHQHWKKIFVVHCGLDPAAFSDVPSYSLSRRFVCVGRLCEQKGQLLLIEAFRRLLERGIDAQLTFAGDGELRPAVVALIQLHRLEVNVDVTGWISNNEVQNQILAARALVLPSFAEGLPVVIMEAMALRRPVISTFVAGIPELVHDGEHGWLVPAGDVEALLDALLECLEASPETLERMGESAFGKLFKAHNVNTEAAKLMELFCDSSRSETTNVGFRARGRISAIP
jgi:colanic acid/amylovoran biosynthesis glycosyltransferase